MLFKLLLNSVQSLAVFTFCAQWMCLAALLIIMKEFCSDFLLIRCWLHIADGMIWAFAGPACFILLVCIIAFLKCFTFEYCSCYCCMNHLRVYSSTRKTQIRGYAFKFIYILITSQISSTIRNFKDVLLSIVSARVSLSQVLSTLRIDKLLQVCSWPRHYEDLK